MEKAHKPQTPEELSSESEEASPETSPSSSSTPATTTTTTTTTTTASSKPEIVRLVGAIPRRPLTEEERTAYIAKAEAFHQLEAARKASNKESILRSSFLDEVENAGEKVAESFKEFAPVEVVANEIEESKP